MRTRKISTQIIVSIIVFVFLSAIVPNIFSNNPFVTTTEAATVKINAKKIILYTGEQYKLKITGIKKKVKWSSSNKSVAVVNAKGVVKAKKAGTVKIIGKVGKKKYTCKITVKKSASLKQAAAAYIKVIQNVDLFSTNNPTSNILIKNIIGDSTPELLLRTNQSGYPPFALMNEVQIWTYKNNKAIKVGTINMGSAAAGDSSQGIFKIGYNTICYRWFNNEHQTWDASDRYTIEIFQVKSSGALTLKYTLDFKQEYNIKTRKSSYALIVNNKTVKTGSKSSVHKYAKGKYGLSSLDKLDNLIPHAMTKQEAISYLQR